MRIPKQVFDIISAASVASTKQGIDGVHLIRQRETCLAFCTDGRMIVEITWPDKSCELPSFSTTMRPEQWRMAITCSRESFTLEEQDDPNLPLTVKMDDAEKDNLAITCPPHEKKFPKHEEVFPRYGNDEIVTICVNPTLLAQVCGIFENLFVTVPRMKMMVPRDPCRPLYFEINGSHGTTARAALMPVRLTKE